MSEFKSKLIGQISGRSVTLTHDLIYESDIYDGVLIVPVGFTTDMASVPRVFWVIFPPWGLYSDAAVVHDYLYRNQIVHPRKLCDQIFLEAMEVKQCSRWWRYTVYSAVRSFGWAVWKKYEKKLADLLVTTPHDYWVS